MTIIDNTYYAFVLVSGNRNWIWRHSENGGKVKRDMVHAAALARTPEDFVLIERLAASDTQQEGWHWQRIQVMFLVAEEAQLRNMREQRTKNLAEAALRKLSQEEIAALKETKALDK